jgi:hypothetical protein
MVITELTSNQYALNRYYSGLKEGITLLTGTEPPENQYPINPIAHEASLVGMQAQCQGLTTGLGMPEDLRAGACLTSSPINSSDIRMVRAGHHVYGIAPDVAKWLNNLDLKGEPGPVSNTTPPINSPQGFSIKGGSTLPGPPEKNQKPKAENPVTIEKYFDNGKLINTFMWNDTNRPDSFKFPKSDTGYGYDVRTCVYATPTAPGVCTWKKSELEPVEPNDWNYFLPDNNGTRFAQANPGNDNTAPGSMGFMNDTDYLG